MKRIVIACDGTWRRLDARHPTNAAKLARAVLPEGPDGTAQVVCHVDGVGSGRGTGALARALDRGLGGLFGMGLMDAIAEAYRFLVFNYAPGDELFVFGFSRGAFTARSLVGLIRNCGIPERARADAIPEALALYRARDPQCRPDGEAALRFRARVAGHVVISDGEADRRAASGDRGAAPTRLAVRYLGVWDTVGALGVPRHLRLARLLNRGLGFHDTRLSGIVQAARHAVAIDERRRTFPPTLWDNLGELNAGAGGPFRQCWFPGDHGSVGGGGPVTALSDDALLWVAEGAAAAGLALDPAALGDWVQGRDWAGPLRASGKATGMLGRMLALDQGPRRGPDAVADLAGAAVRRWHGDPGYRPAALGRVAAVLDAGRGAPGSGGLPGPVAPPLGA